MKSYAPSSMVASLFGPRQRFYAPHTRHGCYRAALSNLLLIEGDRQTAEKVFWGYPAHEFVGAENATIAATAPRILRDLTGCAYEGTLYADCHGLQREVEQAAKERFRDKADRLAKAVRDDMDAGNIKPLAAYANGSGNALYLVAYDFMGVCVGHWVTAVPSQDLFIDDGVVKQPLHPLAVFGVLALRKNGRE